MGSGSRGRVRQVAVESGVAAEKGVEPHLCHLAVFLERPHQ
jgi:hypothetical protein